MAIHATYTEARANLARLWDQATNDRETVIVSRRGADDVAMIAADELTSLQETAHLLRSPANAARLLAALRRLGSNLWSRRLTQEHRVVSLVRDDRIDFLQARYHY